MGIAEHEWPAAVIAFLRGPRSTEGEAQKRPSEGGGGHRKRPGRGGIDSPYPRGLLSSYVRSCLHVGGECLAVQRCGWRLIFFFFILVPALRNRAEGYREIRGPASSSAGG